MEAIRVREMTDFDSEMISNAFLAQGWNKPVAQYIQYQRESREKKRLVLIAECNGAFAGYVTVLWQSNYPPFHTQGIPEIADFNVLIKFQRLGIGTKLIDTAEHYVAKHTGIVGIGVGLTADYGPAQILYVNRGYFPDGLGIFQQGKHLTYGDQAVVNDDLVLYFTKPLIPYAKQQT